MSVYIDRKYLGTISHRLDRFSQKNTDLYNFRCPFCGDSRKNKIKARGYIYRKNNDYFFRCHNCGVSTSFSNFLKHVDSGKHKEYVLERYAAGDNGHSNYEKPNFDDLRGNAFAKFASTKKSYTPSIKSIADLEEDHYARKYILGRKIPKSCWSSIYYTDKFKDFLDLDFPDHGKENVPNDDRIVLFYKDKGGSVTNVAGRALSDTEMRYITIKIRDEKKVFGLERVDTSKPVYVVEGQFDSMFLDNCVAAGDSALAVVAEQFDPTVKTILVWDNEPRNREIVKSLELAITVGHNVVIWPSGIEQKDINDMVMAGVDVQGIINTRVFNGAIATMEFINWKRVV